MAARSMRTVLILLTFLALTLPAHAEKKVALIIGNEDYDHFADVRGAGPGAVAISGAFERLGFAVTLVRNADASTLRSGLEQFAIAAGDAAVSAVYFAGHGLQVDGETYVIPTDARLKNIVLVGFELISLDSLVATMKWTQAPNLFFLDMCGGNAFKRMMTADAAQTMAGCGHASVDPGTGTIVSYAGRTVTSVGNDVDGISPYTRAVLKFIEQPGLELNEMIENVRRDVMHSTDSRQEPFSRGSLAEGDHYLLPDVQAASLEVRASNRDEAARAWHLIRDTRDRDVVEAYLDEFGDISRFYALLAGKRLADLERNTGIRATDVATPVSNPLSSGQDGSAVVRRVAVKQLGPTPRGTVPTPAQKDNRAIAMRGSLVRSIQTELNRIGCSAGSPDGVWGEQSRNAVRSYVKTGPAELASLEPNAALLARLQREPSGMCRVDCGKGQALVKGRCVAKACAKGQFLSSNGECRFERKTKVAAPCTVAPRRNSIGECVPSNITVSKATARPDDTRRVPHKSVRAGNGNSFRQKGVTGYTPGFCYQSARHLC